MGPASAFPNFGDQSKLELSRDCAICSSPDLGAPFPSASRPRSAEAKERRYLPFLVAIYPARPSFGSKVFGCKNSTIGCLGYGMPVHLD
jgi:hypothetical protein